ncbi:B1 bradykinin receptor-like [Actinia tenebrosa]|uniref:B1 bradykinin receptor-like n=1 Tax=Actinia tenebrosa TaxID=6105 RepID=A0A6P8HFV4_ACTTE|nr:B1 bradykinin receptor-like [Actinia tenebrosa]
MNALNSNVTKNCSTLKCVEALGWYKEPTGSIAFRLSIFCFVILCSLIGNFIVVKAIRERPHLRKPFPYFVVTSLAVAELIGTICLPFFQAYDDLMTWPFGDTMCRLINAFMLISYFVIPWSLATIAYLRFRTFSKRQIFFLSGKRIVFFMGLMWFCGCLVSAPTYIFALEVKTIYDNHSYWCIELFPGDTLHKHPSLSLRRYYFVRFVLNFALPGFIIVFAYGGVASKLKRHLIASTQQAHSDRDDGEPEPHTLSTINNTSTSESLGNVALGESVPSEAESHTDIRQDERMSGDQLKEIENDILRMIYIVILIYVGCYVPYQVVFLMEYFGSALLKWKYYVIARKYVYLLTCFPSALHPVCYGTMSKFYAQVFSRLILCKKARR